MKKKILIIGGIVNILLAIGHMLFWKLDSLNWAEELPKMSILNQGILQIANIILIFIILYFAVMSFIMAKHDKIDLYAKSIIICICGFYSIRLLLGYPFFGYHYRELMVWIICIILIVGYLSILFMKKSIIKVNP
jgi:hypothetical protein